MSDQTSPDWERADYAPSSYETPGAVVSSVEEGSPADCAGLEAGMRIVSVNGIPLDDIITWRWEGSDEELELEVEGVDETVVLEREEGEDWGVEFSDVLFDGVRTCVNACPFCFMTMLPKGMRKSLYLRDDDYRLSFLQGNFVTLTNLSDDDLERIVALRLEPMNVSLHAVSPDARERLIGRHAERGMRALERLCDEGIEVHAQIVLCPGLNDGEELERTLSWVEERENISSLAIVPLGYTRYSPKFSSSFSDQPQLARDVVELVRPYQQRAREQLGITRFQLSDEFYLISGESVPEAPFYDGYPQYYDGIGMLRSFMDDVDAAAEGAGEAEGELRRAIIVCGYAAEGVMGYLVKRLGLTELVRVMPIENRFFGGNVDVTGLICGCDLLEQLPERFEGELLILPSSMFNADGLTLDDMAQTAIPAELRARGGDPIVTTITPATFLSLLCRV